MYNIYSCTSNYQCPEEAKLLIRKKNKCIDNCSKDKTYKYQFTGECLVKCPDDTNTNGYKCEVKNTKYCSLSIFQLDITFNDLINNNINTFSKNYVEEFNYTNNQIINYTNKEYSLVFYKNSSCIKELPLTVPTIDFGECYEKIKLTYDISDDLVIAILDKYYENGNSVSSYLLYHPITGEKINASEICKNQTIIMKENVLTIPGVDPALVQFFADQDINVFNISDKFYTDICKHYKSPNNKDIPLKLRLQLFFPNVSLCDKGCLSKGVDLKTMESICHCPFTDISQNTFISNVFEFSETLGEIYSFMSNSNFDILFCIKKIFKYKYFKRCIGGYIIMALFLFQVACVSIYFLKSKNKLKIYIYYISNSYIESLKSDLKKEPPKKLKLKTEGNNKEKKHLKTKPNMESFSTDKNLPSYNDKNYKRKKKSINKNITYFSKFANQIIIQNIHNKKNSVDYSNLTNINSVTSKNISLKGNNPKKAYNNTKIKEYLSTDLNDLDFEDIIEKDKRTFSQYFYESIKEKHLIINSFFIIDNLKPKSIKIIIFLLNIVCCGLINGLMHSEEYLTELYRNNEKDNFFSFIPRSLRSLIYTFLILQVLNQVINCFFVEEKKLKGIFIRGKQNIKKIKEEIFALIKKIEKQCFIFIVISFIIFAFSWAYISCFNDVYFYTRIDWIKSTLFFILLFQIVSVLICLFETIIRYISIKCKSEKLFKLSQFIS